MIPAADLGLPEPEETGGTFIANAEIKARAAADRANIPRLPTIQAFASRRSMGSRHQFRALGGACAGFRRRHGQSRTSVVRGEG